jgi:hypothetical protein
MIDLSIVSKFEAEKEVLIAPGTIFEIMESKYDTN